MAVENLHSLPMEGITLEEVEGYSASVKGSPFKEGHVRLFSRAVIEVEGESDPYFRKISVNHGRSYEIIQGKVLWADEFGNLYMSLNSKGNNFTSPKVRRQNNSPTGFRFFGLQDDSSLVRVIRASELLRSQNVDTEAIVKVIIPTDVPHQSLSGEERMPVKKFKEELFSWAAVRDGKISPKSLDKLKEVLRETNFVVTIRATQVSERISDLVVVDPEERSIIERAFQFINFEEELKAKKDKSHKSERFNIDDINDWNRFFGEYLPKRAARNLAKMHKRGLIHKYPVVGNMSMIGGICDLDSVRGLALGDRSVTTMGMIQDLWAFLYDQGGNVVNIIEKLAEDGVDRETSQKFIENFIKEYTKEMDWDNDIKRFYGIIGLTRGLHERERIRLVDYYLDKIAEKEGLYIFLDGMVAEIIEKSGFLKKSEILEGTVIASNKLLHYVFNDKTRNTIKEEIVKKFSGRKLGKSERKSIEIFAEAFAPHYLRNFALQLIAV